MKYAWLLLLIVLMPVFVMADDTSSVSVRDLIIIGLQNNIGLQVEETNIPLAEKEIIVNQAAFDPELFISTQASNSVTPLASTSSPLDTFEEESFSGQLGVRKNFLTGLSATLSLQSAWEDNNDSSEILDPRYRTGLNLSLTQPLLKNFGRDNNQTNIRLEQKKLSQTELAYQLRAQNLAFSIETLAIQLANENDIVRLRQEAVDLSSRLYEANRKRFDVGVIAVTEVQEAETDLASRHLNLSLARQNRELTLEELSRLLNYSLRADRLGIQLTPQQADQAPIPSLEMLFREAKDRRLDLQSQKIDIEMANLQSAYADNQLKPKLDLNMNLGVNGLSGREQGTQQSRYAGDWFESLDSLSQGDGYQWQVGLEFSLPFGNNAAKARYQQSLIRTRQAQHQILDSEAQLKQELQQQLTVIKHSRQQLEIARRFQALAETSLEQESRRQEEGLSDTFRIIIFQNKMVDAKINRTSALRQLQLAQAQLSYISGSILQRHAIQLPSQPRR